MDVLIILATVVALIALIFAYGLSAWAGRSDEGSDGMKELSGFIREGAEAFLKREHIVMAPVVLVFSVILGLAINWTTAALYAAGAFFAALTGVFGIRAAVQGSTRTASAAMNAGLNQALIISLRCGAVTGLCVAGLGLLGVGGFFAVMGIDTVTDVTGFGFGAATAALFGSSAGTIYKKAADVGADFVGKAKAKLTEGDPRNPAAMAGLAGDYAGTAAGMGVDLFQSYAASIIAAAIIAARAKSINPLFGYPFDLPAVQGTAFPLLVSAAGIIGTMAGIMLIGGKTKSEPLQAINAGSYLCAGITAAFSIIFSWVFFGNFNCSVCILIGMLVGAVYGKITRTYTSGTSRRLKKLAERSQNGYLIVSEYGIGMLSVLWPVVFLAAGLLTANAFAGYYGITLAAAGMLSTAGIKATINAYAPVSANAGEIARMARLSDEAKEVSGKLDQAGKINTAAGKGFAAGAAALAAAALLAAYAEVAGLNVVNLLKPAVLAGLLAGAALPVLLPAMSMNAACNTAVKIIEDAKRQFDSNAGIMKGASRPDYAKCADAGTKAALKGIIAPGVLAVAVPLAAGIFLGAEAAAGLLAGSLVSGTLTAVLLANTGGAWNHTDKHAAGDPFKDAAGSSVNIVMKLTAITALVFAPVFLALGGI